MWSGDVSRLPRVVARRKATRRSSRREIPGPHASLDLKGRSSLLAGPRGAKKPVFTRAGAGRKRAPFLGGVTRRLCPRSRTLPASGPRQTVRDQHRPAFAQADEAVLRLAQHGLCRARVPPRRGQPLDVHEDLVRVHSARSSTASSSASARRRPGGNGPDTGACAMIGPPSTGQDATGRPRSLPAVPRPGPGRRSADLPAVRPLSRRPTPRVGRAGASGSARGRAIPPGGFYAKCDSGGDEVRTARPAWRGAARRARAGSGSRGSGAGCH